MWPLDNGGGREGLSYRSGVFGVNKSCPLCSALGDESIGISKLYIVLSFYSLRTRRRTRYTWSIRGHYLRKPMLRVAGEGNLGSRAPELIIGKVSPKPSTT
jgi:hypothetical protein